MSISRHIDEYLAERGIVQSDAVVPESECQVFDGDVELPGESLEQVRGLVLEVLDSEEHPQM
ncbi:hypothetical protein WG915_08555 [Corynebacterium sp. H128]|uniref:hypothetical protein n=1 Tax=unclassified Corynebacterium TaxID=2624378 RepID=UPI0030B05F4C